MKKRLYVSSAILIAMAMTLTLSGCLDVFFGDDDPATISRAVSRLYFPFEVESEEGEESIDGSADHSFRFYAKNISDFDICDAKCKVFAGTSLANNTVERDEKIKPGESWFGSVSFDASVAFSLLKDGKIEYEFSYSKCDDPSGDQSENPIEGADITVMSTSKGKTPDGKPMAEITIKNTGTVPVHNIRTGVTVVNGFSSEARDWVEGELLYIDGQTLMPGETAVGIAVFEGIADFAEDDYITVFPILFDEGEGGDV